MKSVTIMSVFVGFVIMCVITGGTSFAREEHHHEADEATPRYLAQDLPTWDTHFLPLPPEVREESPPVSTTDLRKRVFVAVASSTTPVNSSHDRGGLYVFRSRDGASWDRAPMVVQTNSHGATACEPVIACNTWVAERLRNHQENHIYLLFILKVMNKEKEVPQVMYSRSVDGNTFSSPIRIDIAGGMPSDPHISIAERGEVTFSWWDSTINSWVIRESHDGDPPGAPQDPCDSNESPN